MRVLRNRSYQFDDADAGSDDLGESHEFIPLQRDSSLLLKTPSIPQPSPWGSSG